MEFHILRTWALGALRATLEPGVDESSERGAGALIQEKHDVSNNTSENILIPCVERHESNCQSAECSSVLGADETYLNRYGGGGVEIKRQRNSYSGENNLQIWGTWFSDS